MTLNKVYTWAVERPKEKMTFLAYVVDVRVYAIYFFYQELG
jgi:hypothetical protein